MSISSTDANLVAGEWAHVSFTYNKFTSNVNLFVNNTLVGSANDVFIDLTKTNTDFAIGYDMDNTGATSHFSGAVDDIQIYNRELTTGEIAYLSNSSNVDLFLKNQLVGHWSFEEFTTVADNFMDKSTFDNTSVVTSGNVSYGSQPSKGNTSIVFDGTNTMSASNEGFNTNYMSIGAWVKPTDSNTTFVEKDGVFSFGLNSNGLPDLKIGDSDTSSLKFLKNLNNSSLKSHLTFEENVKDSVGYTQAVATNTTFQTDSYNPSIGGSSMVLDGVDSYVNTGKILENINDPNQMTMGMWVNLQDLEEGKSYPLVSVNNGFEWWVDKNGDNAKLNYYQPGVVEFSIGTFSVADNVGTGNIVITTETDKTYSVALFTGELDMNDADDINKFKTVAVNVSGSITADAGVEQTIPFTVNEIYNYDDLTANTLDKANNGYLYVSVAGGELNESKVLVNESFKSYTTDQYDMTPDNLTLTQVSNGFTDSSYVGLSDNYFSISNRSTSIVLIFRINETTAYQTLTSIQSNALAMNDFFLITGTTGGYKMYYRKTDDVWTLFNTGSADIHGYSADVYDNTFIASVGNNLEIITVIPGETQDDVPTISVVVLTGTNTHSYRRPKIYENTIVYEDTNNATINVLEKTDSGWEIVKTYSNMFAYGALDVYKNTLVCKDNATKLKMYVFEKVNGIWNDSESATFTLSATLQGTEGSTNIYENYILVGSGSTGTDATLFTRENGIWNTTGQTISYGSNQSWVAIMNKDTIVLGRASTAYLYKGVTTPANLTPVITQTATYRPFENDIQISGTIFSSHNSFKKVYQPLVFANDVDAAILTEEYLKAYVSNPDNNVQGYTVEFAKDLVNEFGTYTTDKAINANGDLIDLVDGDGNYNIYLLFEDNVGEIHFGTSLSFVVSQDDLLLHLDFITGDVTDQSTNGYTVNLVGTTDSTINGYGSKTVLNNGNYIEIPSVSWTYNETWTVAVVLEVLATGGSNYFHIASRGVWSIELDRLQIGGTNITVSQFNDVVGFKGILLGKQDGKNIVKYTVYNLEDGSVFSQKTNTGITYTNDSNVLGTTDYTSPAFIMVGTGIKTEEVSKAKYGEVIVYNRFFDDFEESRLVSYLSRKWTTGKTKYTNTLSIHSPFPHNHLTNNI
jgi:hypothetical protein